MHLSKYRIIFVQNRRVVALARQIYGSSPLKGGAKLDEHIADTAADIVQRGGLLLEGCYQPLRSGLKIASACSLGLILGGK